MDQEMLTKISEILKPDLIKSYSSEKDDVPMVDKIIQMIGLDTKELSKKEIENTISNYVFISEKIRSDLIEIEEHIKKLKSLDVDGAEEYSRKKYRHFSQLNKNARDEIISFSNTKLITYLLEHKNVNFYLRKDDESLMFMLNCMYEYACCRKYFEYGYDFSSEAKFHFTPGASIFETSKIISEYASLKKSCAESYYSKIHEDNVREKLPEYLSNMIARNYLISKRSEIFNTLNSLYNEGKYQSFISLAVLQIEGLFHDLCVLNDEKDFLDNTGTLVEKAEKTLTAHRHYRLAIYPYYAFHVPVMRNEIAHKGMITGFDLQQISDELLIDLHTIIKLICDKVNNKYYALFMLYEKLESLDDKSDSSIAITFITELLASNEIHGCESIRILCKPESYEEEYNNILSLSDLCINKYGKKVDNIIKYLSGFAYSAIFWQTLKDQTQVVIENSEIPKSDQPFDFISFAVAMKNDFIGKLPDKSESKEACIQLSALLKQLD